MRREHLGRLEIICVGGGLFEQLTELMGRWTTEFDGEEAECLIVKRDLDIHVNVNVNVRTIREGCDGDGSLLLRYLIPGLVAHDGVDCDGLGSSLMELKLSSSSLMELKLLMELELSSY